MWILIRILLLIRVLRWPLVFRPSTALFLASTSPLKATTVLHGSVLSLYSFWILQIRIQLSQISGSATVPETYVSFIWPCFFLLFRGRATSGVWGGRTHQSASGLRQKQMNGFIVYFLSYLAEFSDEWLSSVSFFHIEHDSLNVVKISPKVVLCSVTIPADSVLRTDRFRIVHT